MANVDLNLVVIRSSDIERAARFYERLGLQFEKHRHGSGPLHYTAGVGGIVFEIYPRKNEEDSTTSTRLGFRIDFLDAVLPDLQAAGGRVLSVPQSSEWGRRAVMEDPDGHRIELIEKATV